MILLTHNELDQAVDRCRTALEIGERPEVLGADYAYLGRAL